MFTKRDLIEGKCSYTQYYNQFVNDMVVRAVLKQIDSRYIIFSRDPLFNDIELYEWDCMRIAIQYAVDKELFAAAKDQFDFNTCVCIAKAAAQHIRNEGLAKLHKK